MIKKILVASITITNSLLLVGMICLGSQNLSTRHSINLGISKTEKYPSGFLIGISVALGSLSGGLTSTLLIPSKARKYY
ncbi:hypothetical protein [Prochlorococcus marinus]|uniref:hypothetical protein n=1 Tax=Prochlorococcus marinus TaxID=1219 RepID=UPI0022B3E76D|nr:hypothetical protein [Prochlorococcus marinus]